MHAGGDNTAWGRWNRGWTSEENRHGDLLNKFLYLSGAVNMRAVEQSVQARPSPCFGVSMHYMNSAECREYS